MKLFKKYIKHHEPDFEYFEEDDGYMFCRDKFCHECKVNDVCGEMCSSAKNKKISPLTLTKSDYEKIQKKYPEYFV